MGSNARHSGLSRRGVLRVGALGGLYLSEQWLGGSPWAQATSPARAVGFGRARRCILLFLTGGPPQHDTWDMKPDAPAEVRGELSPIATNVPGIFISELFPRLARHADKYCLVRSVTHGDNVHTSAGYTMLTGAYHPQANAPTASDIRPLPNDRPHLGALLDLARPATNGWPTHVALPEVIKDANVNEFPGQHAGFLGKPHEPFRVFADEARASLRVPPIALPADISTARLSERVALLERCDSRLASVEDRLPNRLTQFSARITTLLRTAAMSEAFDLSRESPATAEAYGAHLFGRGCLLARRLIEAGVPLATVYWHYEGPDDSPVWDTHWNNFRHLRERLMPPTDQAVSALLADLHERGLLADTLVVCMGEFGRTPKINSYAGRDHWGPLQSILLAGAGLRGGTTYGKSDAIGAYPAENPVRPPDLFATFLHLLGVPCDLPLRDLMGRELVAVDGEPVAGLLE